MKNQIQPKAWSFFKNALKLRCPECGKCRVFIPFSKVRRLKQWLHPLDSCPCCGYSYEREPGYFLVSIWAINLGLIGGFGTGAMFLLDSTLHLPIWETILIIGPAIPALNLLFVRHAKSLFLAMDHYFDPHVTQTISVIKAVPKATDHWK